MNKALGVFLLLWLPTACVGLERKVELSWSDLDPAIQGKKISLVLPDGAHLEGPVLTVDREALMMEVTKSSETKLHPKGKTRVPRAAVTTVEVHEHRTKWQILGTAIGAAPGIVICAGFTMYAHNEGGWSPLMAAACVGTLGGGAGLGYWAGRSADKTITCITVKDTTSGSAAAELERSGAPAELPRQLVGVAGRPSYPAQSRLAAR